MENDSEKPTNLWPWRELQAGLASQATVIASSNSTSADNAHTPGTNDRIQRVVVDSRLVAKGDLFIALPGDPGPRFNPSYTSDVDGHDFVQHALANGAVAAIVARPVPVELPQIIVNDTYDALWQLGAMARDRLHQPICAITGSSGKTTAKHFLTEALSAYSPPGSFNNHIGVPLALANARLDAPACVFEIGTSGPGEIGPLSMMVRPDLAILLNVHNAHIENFSGRAALIEEKAQIFAPMDTSSAGIKVVEAALGMPGYNFGAEQGADARILDIQGDSLVLSLFGEKLSARIPGGGVHRANTLAAVILATKLLDVDLSAALNLADTVIPDGRGNVIDVGGVIIVDDSYNANPASMGAAIDAFCQRQGRRKVAVLGDMRELGDESIAAHKGLLEHLEGFDEVFLVGDAMLQMAVSEGFLSAPVLTRNAGTIFKNLHFYPEADESLLQDLVDSVGTDDCLLVKGSNRVFWASDFVSKLCKAISKK